MINPIKFVKSLLSPTYEMEKILRKFVNDRTTMNCSRRNLFEAFILEFIVKTALVLIFIFLTINFNENSDNRSEQNLRDSVTKQIRIPDHSIFKDQNLVKKMWSLNKMSLKDDKLIDHLQEESNSFDMEVFNQKFKLDSSLLGIKEGNLEGANYYSVLKGRRVYDHDCFLVTFDYRNEEQKYREQG